jgi:hypothetical protein
MTVRARGVMFLSLGQDGKPVVGGNGSLKAIITGDVVDEEGKRIGDFHDLAMDAMDAWERLLGDYQIPGYPRKPESF